MAYNMHESKTAKKLSVASSKLVYGSAKILGFAWQDYTCIQPIKNGLKKGQLKNALKKSKCSLFKFLALYRTAGIHPYANGILGLSPHKLVSKKEFHYLWSLKNHGLIDHAIVSFSLTRINQTGTDKPYALFGGYNSSQIVGGAKGLKTFKRYLNRLGTWALEGQNTFYGNQAIQIPDKTYPAIIDTGSTQMSIPSDIYNQL